MLVIRLLVALVTLVTLAHGQSVLGDEIVQHTPTVDVRDAVDGARTGFECRNTQAHAEGSTNETCDIDYYFATTKVATLRVLKEGDYDPLATEFDSAFAFIVDVDNVDTEVARVSSQGAGQLIVAEGTLAAPGIAFQVDSSSGFFAAAANDVRVVSGGVQAMVFDPTATVSVLPFRLANGSASAPGLAFQSDTNTGLFRTTADQLQITAGGTTRLAIDTNSVDVSVPTLFMQAAPTDSAKLDFRASSGTAFQLWVDATGGGDFRFEANTTATEAIEFENTGTGLMAVFIETSDGVLTDLTDGAHLTTGTVDQARLDANVVMDNEANTWTTGAQDMGAATSFEIPNGATQTTSVAGQVATDTTDEQLIGGANSRVIAQPTKSACAVVENLAAADDDFPMPVRAGQTIELISAFCHCQGTCTTEADLSFEYVEVGTVTPTVTDVTGTITCEDYITGDSAVAFSGNTTVQALDVLRFDVDNAVSPETDTYSVCVNYRLDPT